MKIGVNLMFLVPGEVGGSEPLLTNLVEAIAQQPETTVVVYAIKGFSSAYPRLAALTNVVEVPWDSGAQGRRILTENSWLAADCRRRRLDVLHHGVGTTPFIKTVPTVVTIHDIQYRHYPENFSTLKRSWLAVNVPHSVRSCEATVTPSQWVKQDLVERLNADASRVMVVPFGSERLFGEIQAPPADVRQRYGLERPFFFFPGRTYQHKNHLFLLEAFAPLAGDLELVFSGAPWHRDREVVMRAKQLGIRSSVRHLGLIPRADLAGVYQAAEALVYPTIFEGFGAPALEAMSLGCPVIASSVTAVPEVVGDAGLLLSPHDAGEWANAMQSVHQDAGLRDRLSKLGYQRAATFTWEAAAEAQMQAYRLAMVS